jgi:DNA sulfur modification protein DndC
LELDVADVWDAVYFLPRPEAIKPSVLEGLYRNVSGERPILKSPQAPPCASGRFGCWTCTVVRRDRSSELLIKAGYESLQPYLDFRNWLATIRNDATRRWHSRRNGVRRAGPFTLKARLEIFRCLRNLEANTGNRLLSHEEIFEILRLWQLDRDVDDSIDWSSALDEVHSALLDTRAASCKLSEFLDRSPTDATCL